MVEVFLFLLLSGLLVRMAHSDVFAPEIGVMIFFAWLRCVLWLSGHIHFQNSLGYLYPVFQIFAAEEAIRLSGYGLHWRLRSGRWWASVGFGLFLGSLAWYRFPGGIITWRISAQIGVFGALTFARLLLWRYEWHSPESLRMNRTRMNLLTLLMFGSILSTRPGGAAFTLATELIHLIAFTGIYWTFPRAPRSRESIKASSSSFFRSATS